MSCSHKSTIRLSAKLKRISVNQPLLPSKISTVRLSQPKEPPSKLGLSQVALSASKHTRGNETRPREFARRSSATQIAQLCPEKERDQPGLWAKISFTQRSPRAPTGAFYWENWRESFPQKQPEGCRGSGGGGIRG